MEELVKDGEKGGWTDYMRGVGFAGIGGVVCLRVEIEERWLGMV